MSSFKYFQIEIPIYNNSILVVVGDNPIEFSKMLDEFGIDYSSVFEFGADFEACTFSTSDGVLIRFKSSVSIGNMAHEAYHATCKILNEAGISQNHETEEVFAYLLGYICDKIKYEILEL